jgi:hypothetical protein
VTSSYYVLWLPTPRAALAVTETRRSRRSSPGSSNDRADYPKLQPLITAEMTVSRLHQLQARVKDTR